MERLDYVASIEDVIAERQHQMIDNGYSSEHDDEHRPGFLADAAVACIDQDKSRWPWGPASWKSKGYRRDLVRAAALVLAEIDRIDRGGAVR